MGTGRTDEFRKNAVQKASDWALSGKWLPWITLP
jgi:hypothetical protein